MTTFEDRVRDYTITEKGLRPEWAGQVIAALKHAEAHSLGRGRLTEAERRLLHCIVLMVEGLVDESAADREYAGATGVLGWALQIVEDSASITSRNPGLQDLAARFRRDLSAYYSEGV
jgi:hypothetical protein